MSNTILIVEDEPRIRHFLRLALEGDGCKVLETSTLSSGLSMVGEQKPSLVVLVLGLPDGDGLSFISQLRTWSDIPGLVLSARSLEADKV